MGRKDLEEGHCDYRPDMYAWDSGYETVEWWHKKCREDWMAKYDQRPHI